jgi:site-specific recombinase XerD
MEPNSDLTEIGPEEAVEKYLLHRENEVSEQTLQSHEYRLNHFVAWCSQEGIESLSDLSPRDLQDFGYWRQRDGDLNSVTLHTQMTTLRVFLKWAGDYSAVPMDFHERVRVPSLPRDKNARDEKIGPERADEILDYLSTYEYSSQRHTLFSLLWHTGMRIGAARALDLDDFHPRDKYIEVHHRPEKETPLKNAARGERPISLDSKRVTLIQDYIKTRRDDVTDDYGREPLFTTSHGRPAISTLRERIYWLARPCKYQDGYCPHGRDEDECEAAQRSDKASQCPSSFSPHTVRRSSITYWLLQDVPEEAVSDRMNVNKNVIDQHYDKRTPNEKMEQRRDYFG